MVLKNNTFIAVNIVINIIYVMNPENIKNVLFSTFMFFFFIHPPNIL